MAQQQYRGEHGCREYLPKLKRVCMRAEVAIVEGRKYCERHQPKGAFIDVRVVRIAPAFFSIVGDTRRGRKWVNTRVQEADHGVAYCDDTRMAEDIYMGAADEGLNVTAVIA